MTRLRSTLAALVVAPALFLTGCATKPHGSSQGYSRYGHASAYRQSRHGHGYGKSYYGWSSFGVVPGGHDQTGSARIDRHHRGH